ncbi:hypothetical protein [Alcaligenes faecalis]|uniref:hypothetical protein n=1 Tax=Alcaligenes faecalis TaxID=511 RepID=UPI00214FDB76|nr:hypothetical protein [Alcaligenes faecalis]MCR4143675.1 hypothetical protein [Alcaligenes faecalis]WGQ35349.1 hypothetical protein QEZ63_15995 [Alcaligenes faecalis]
MIRSLLTTLASVLFPVALQAQANEYTLEDLANDYAQEYAKTKTCEQIYEDAYATMKARQAGIPMPEIMEMAGKYHGLRNMVMFAYRSPQFGEHRPERREGASVEFANDYYQACLTANPQGRAYFPFEEYLRTSR